MNKGHQMLITKVQQGCTLFLLCAVAFVSSGISSFFYAAPQAYAAPSTDYIVPLDIEMNEDNGGSFDLKDLLGSAYTDGGLLPDYLSAATGFCVSDATTPATWDGSVFAATENLCTTPETFTIPADTTTIRITAYGTNNTDSEVARDDDYIQITSTIDLDPNSIGNNTYSGFMSFPYIVDKNVRPTYAFAQVPLGSPSNTVVVDTGSPIGDNFSVDTITFDVTGGGTTLEITQSQTLVNTGYLVEFLSNVSNSSLLRSIESVVLEPGAAAGVGVTQGSVPIPQGTDYAVITEVAGRSDVNSSGEAKMIMRAVAEFQPTREEYSKIQGVIAGVIGRGEQYTTTYVFEDLDSFGPTSNGLLSPTSESTVYGDITATDAVLSSPDIYVSGGDLIVSRTFEVADSAGDLFADQGGFTSQYTVEFYERAETASAAQFLGSSADNMNLNSGEDSRVTCDPTTAAGAENCLDLVIPSGASLGLLTLAGNNFSGSSGVNENWGAMSAIVEIDKEVSPGVYENKVSGTWIQTRASNPDLVSWANLDFDMPLFNYDGVSPATNGTTGPNNGFAADGSADADAVVVSNKTDYVSLTDTYAGSTEFSRIAVAGQDTLRISMERDAADGGGNSFGQNNFVASIQWFGPEPLLFSNVPEEFGFTDPALNLGGGNWQLGANAIINGTITLDPPAGYNNDGEVDFPLSVARASDPANTAGINISVIPATDIMQLDDVDPNDPAPAGNTVADILSTSNSSPTANDSGIAITGVAIDSGVGTWEYSLDAGATWSAITGATPLSALLLGPDDMLRVVPAGESMTGSVDFLSWDESAYAAGDVVNPVVGSGDDFTLFGDQGDTATVRTVSAPGATEANLLLWYKADDGPNTATGGANITRWADVGTAGNDAFALSGQEPTFISATPDRNYNPSADFSGAGMETLTTNLLTDNNAYTKVAVVTQVANASTQSIIGAGVGGDHRFEVSAGTGDVKIGHGASYIYGTPVTPMETSIVVARYEDGGVIDNYVRTDGVSTVDNTSYPYVDGASIQIGAHNDGEFFDGEIAEAIVYDGAVGNANINQIESYLAIKYGLTLPTDYVDSASNLVYAAAASTYNNGILGLARDDATALDQRVAHSQEVDAILSIATDNDFTAANADLSRTGLPNATYLVGGHDGGATTFTGTYNGVSGDAMARVWQFSETLESGDITFSIPSTTIFPAGIPVVVKSTDLTFDGLDAGAELLDDGTTFTGTMNIADGEYVTFAVEQAPTVASIERLVPTSVDTNDTTVTFRVTFSEDVKDVDVADLLTVKSGTVTGDVQSVTLVTNSVYEVTVNNITGNGTLGLALAGDNDVNDNFGIALSSPVPTGNNQSYTVDTDAPAGPTITAPTAGDPVSSPMTVVGQCTGAEGGSISFTTSPAGGIVPDPTTGVVDGAGNYSVNVVWSGSANGGTYDLIATCTDTAGNSSSNTVLSGLQPDLQGPQAQLEQSSVQDDPTNALAAQFTLTFSEPINDTTLAVADFDVSASTAPGAAVSTVSEISPLDGTTFKVTVTATADGDVVVALPAGTVEDVAGNLNAAALSIDNVVTIDVTAPAAPTINTPTSGQTVNSPTDVNIECNEAGETITITNANIVPNPTTYTCTAAGPQSVPVSWAPGTDGAETLDVTLTDAAGNVSPVSGIAVDVDLDDPGVSVEQASSQADPANVFPLTWTIAFSEPIDPATFTVSDLSVVVSPAGSVPVGVITQVAPNDDTVWEYTITSGVVTDDEITVSLPVASVTDVSGNDNTVSISADNRITFDNTPPVAPVLSSPVDGDPAGNPTTIAGTCEPGATVTINNPNLQGSPIDVVCDATGNFTVDALWAPGTSGAQDIDVTQTDAAGNVSPTATVTGLQVDLDPPTNPTISFPDPAGAPGATTDGTISGSGTPGDTIEVSIAPGGQACTAVVQPDGTWTCDVSPAFASSTDEGPIFIEAVAVDPAGNQSGPASTFAVADVTAPAGTTISSPALGPNGETPADNNPTTVAGVCEPGSTVTITNPLIIPDPTETICNPDGTYSVDVLWDPAAQGATSTLSVFETDPAGNVGPTTTVDVYVDLAPTMDSPDPLTGLVGEPTTVAGTCEPGGVVTLTGPGFDPDPTTVVCDSDGTYSTVITPNTSGPINIAVSQVDSTGAPFPSVAAATTVVPFTGEEPANAGGTRTGGGGGGGGSRDNDTSNDDGEVNNNADLVSELDSLRATLDSLSTRTNTVCEPYITENIRFGGVNNPNEVNKLLGFLNDHEGESLALDGTYDADDFAAVKRFQSRYASSVLEVWGLTEPTGYVYLTTRMKINSFNCNKAIQCPAFTQYNSLSRNENTVSPEVERTKIFMTELGFYTGAINQVWDQGIHVAMIDFQETFAETMLAPWDLTAGTGYKYKTTNKFLNEMVGCDTAELVLENGATVSY